MAIKQLWVEKHRPRDLSTYVFQDQHQRKQIEGIIREQSLPHLLLTGTPGSGKTTLARILIRALEVDPIDLLYANASEETGADFIRDKVIPFIGGYPMGAFKVVHLEEFDYLSQNAQGMLRVVLEDASSTCRFICSCNYEHKIVPAMRSRFTVHMRFKSPSEEEVVVKMIDILEAENVSFDDETLFRFIKQAYPDLRKIINNMEQNVIDGRLVLPAHATPDGDYKFKLLDMLVAADLNGIRKIVSERVPQEELEEVYRFLWQNLSMVKAFKESSELYDKAILVLAEAMKTHGVSAVPHLTFEAACIRLMMVLRS